MTLGAEMRSPALLLLSSASGCRNYPRNVKKTQLKPFIHWCAGRKKMTRVKYCLTILLSSNQVYTSIKASGQFLSGDNRSFKIIKAVCILR